MVERIGNGMVKIGVTQEALEAKAGATGGGFTATGQETGGY